MAEIEIVEVDGLGRKMVLRGASMPFVGVAFGVEQRISTVNYVGNPIAAQRVLGAKFPSTIMEGRWDRQLFRGNDRPLLEGFGDLLAQVQGVGVSAGAPGGGVATTPYEAVEAVGSIVRAGSKLRVTWRQTVRYGRLKMWEPKWGREGVVEWSAEFEWTGDQLDPPKPGEGLPDAAAWVASIRRLVTGLVNAVNTVRTETISFWGDVQVGVGELVGLANDAVSTLERIVDAALEPAETFAALRSSYEKLRERCGTLLDLTQERLAELEMAQQQQAREMLFAAQYSRETQRYIELLMEDAALRAAEIEALLEKTTEQVFVAPSAMTLREIAVRFMGSPDAWVEIGAHNNLAGSVVAAGTRVRIPRRQ